MHRALFAFVVSALVLAAPSAFAQDEVGAGQAPICCGSECCLIEGDCYMRGDENPANECQMCDPANGTSWTNVTGCTVAEPDAGTGGGGGGGCSAAPGAGSSGAALLVVGALGALLRRRR